MCSTGAHCRNPGRPCVPWATFVAWSGAPCVVASQVTFPVGGALRPCEGPGSRRRFSVWNWWFPSSSNNDRNVAGLLPKRPGRAAAWTLWAGIIHPAPFAPVFPTSHPLFVVLLAWSGSGWKIPLFLRYISARSQQLPGAVESVTPSIWYIVFL